MRRRAARLQTRSDDGDSRNLALAIQRQVEARMEAVERKLVREMAEHGHQMIGEAAAVISQTLERRVDSLERDAAAQLRQLSIAQQAADATHGQIEAVVERLQSGVAQAVSESAIERGVRRRVPGHRTDSTLAKHYCPNCGSSDVGASRRDGMLEHFLRLFFVQPLRCRKCFRRFFGF